ncbi:hypothetical protein HMPREF9081_0483 [Centipeda periodontii DSM 2778]|uniref:Uncharacterized protein n=1 Tax=Centipeda periodontii DSM 2778 TaxID=888060 RepID=F5RJP8_9FIRM|nr:hypothetical protein HMPREF9081_0483 [Centipeda periodontii DSM 2778]
MLRMVPLPRCGRGGWGSHIPSPCGDVVLKLLKLVAFSRPCMSFRPLAGMWF